MNLIALIVISIVFVIFILSLIFYLNISKKLAFKYSKNKLLNDDKAFTYKNILNALGGIENIDEVDGDKIKLLAITLVDQKKLKKLAIKFKIEQNYISLFIKGFDINNFYKKLSLNLKKDN